MFITFKKFKNEAYDVLKRIKNDLKDVANSNVYNVNCEVDQIQFYLKFIAPPL